MTNVNRKRGIGDKVLGWFIETEDETEDERDAPEIVEAPPATRPSAPAPPKPLAPAPGLAEADRERLSTVVTLVETLPAEAAVEVKRAIVAASLEAFGVSIDRILAAGEGALDALDAHAEDNEARLRESLAAAEKRIAALNAEAADVGRQMDQAVAAQHERARGVAAERSRLVAALDFFGRRARGASAPRLVRLT